MDSHKDGPMRLVALLPLIALAAGVAAPAIAQGVDARMKKMVAEQAEDTAKLIGEIKTGKLEEDATAKFDFPIEPGKTYWLYAACDHCDDINLEGKDERGNVLDYDDGDDADPVLLVSDKRARQLKVTVSMKTCGKSSCAFGIGLYEGALVWPGGPPEQ